jgi:hypothetical protein
MDPSTGHTDTPDDLLARALRLPAEGRQVIVNGLLLSLESDPIREPDAAWDAAWLEEVERRAQDEEEGGADSIDWQDLKAEALSRIARDRGRDAGCRDERP